jgi:hypothetical protein
MKERKFYIKILLIFVFGAAFGYIEAAVVVYLRDIYYPQGFHFPIKHLVDKNLYVEVLREFSTLVIMASISTVLSRKFWEGFGYFIMIFGIWDIFYYVWLKAAIDWPASFFTPDILFLVPLPWIGPVLAPVIISIVMILIGIDITRLFSKGYIVKPGLIHWILVLVGSASLLYSFMNDTDAGFHEKYPQPYNWLLFVIGLILFITAYIHLHRKTVTTHEIEK